jgi:anti-sigma B factor antagonist
MEPEEVQFTVEVLAGVDGPVVVPRGELDVATQGELRAALEREATAGGTLTLDLSGLRFIDTSGLRLVLEVAEAARRGGSRFVVLPGDATIQRPFEVAGVVELVPFRSPAEGA